MELRNTAQIDAALRLRLPELEGRFVRVAGLSPEGECVARLVSLYLGIPVVSALIATAAGDDASPVVCGHAQLDGGLAIDLDGSAMPADRPVPDGWNLAAVFATDADGARFDMVFETVPRRPVFPWNFLDHDGLDRCCFDIDGVLCENPTPWQNDDGLRYRAFLESARPLHRPRGEIGWLVTSRLEKYRPLTEAWMAKNGISYRELRMIDLPTKEARLRARCHASFKAECYRQTDAELFIESDLQQAQEIARLTRRRVLCVDAMTLIDPDATRAHALRPRLWRSISRRLWRRLGTNRTHRVAPVSVADQSV